MSNDQDPEAFAARWNIRLSDAQIFEDFRGRVLAAFEDFLPEINDEELARVFVQVSGRSGNGYENDCKAALRAAESFRDLVWTVQHVFYALAEMATSPTQIDRFVSRINKALMYSPGVDLGRLERVGRRVQLFPAGARELDEALVCGPFQWLEVFPEARRQFAGALDIISRQDERQYRSALDSLRFAVESVLKQVLKNDKPLEKQGQPLLRWLEEKGAHAQIRNTYQAVLDRFSLYQNDAVKHPSGDADAAAYSAAEMEYQLHQVGLLIRFVIQLMGRQKL